jgi:hypothetical protein
MHWTLKLAPAALLLTAVAACNEAPTGSAELTRSGTAEAEAACIMRVDQNNGHTGAYVTSSEFSQAGSTVMLSDRDGTSWRCLASNDGTVEDLAVTNG